MPESAPCIDPKFGMLNNTQGQSPAGKCVGMEGNERYWLYDHDHERLDDFMAHLDGVLAGDPARTASVAVLVSKEGVEAGIDRAQSSPRFDIGERSAIHGDGMFTIKLSRNGEDPGHVLVAKAPGSFVYLAITDEPRRFVDRTFGPFIKALYPHVSQAYLSAGDLYSVLERLEKSSGGQIMVARMTAYRRLRAATDKEGRKNGGASSPHIVPERRKSTESAVTYTNKPFREAFSDAAANDQWISRISFNLLRGTASPMHSQLSRNGLFRFKRSIAPFYHKVSPLVVEIVDKKTKLYSNRSREDNNGTIRPLAITLDSVMAKDHSENSTFIKSVESMAHITVSVYHSNPYVHMSLVDYLDGSSFDIWILSVHKIIIVPQMRATHTSIARLTNHIFERFGEGSVTDHE